MTLANAHALFCGLKNSPSYLANLTITDSDREELMSARKKIRATLRKSSKHLLSDDEYWQEGTRFRNSWRERPQSIDLKFMTQGSFAYHTLNSPAQFPAQEIDLDDGMYVPVDFLDNGEPALAAKALFEFVEKSLSRLCDLNGWHVQKKTSCVRVQIRKGAHIDVPVYSIPRVKFELLVENLNEANFSTGSLARDHVSTMIRLPSDQVMLALKNGSWLASDPQKLHEWVQSRRERYGAAYIRVCRFFKGWRDFTWKDSALSSLCIMRAVDMALEELHGFPTEERDDELIMKVAELLPDYFNSDIKNPVLTHLSLNEWDSTDRASIVNAANVLNDEISSALKRTGDADLVVKKLQSSFGKRIPYRPDIVKIGSQIEAIQKSDAATVPAPKVIASTSG